MRVSSVEEAFATASGNANYGETNGIVVK